MENIPAKKRVSFIYFLVEVLIKLSLGHFTCFHGFHLITNNFQLLVISKFCNICVVPFYSSLKKWLLAWLTFDHLVSITRRQEVTFQRLHKLSAFLILVCIGSFICGL